MLWISFHAKAIRGKYSHLKCAGLNQYRQYPEYRLDWGYKTALKGL
ncbi:MAG: hypothetical protein ACI9XU_000034 [Arenicella sp.]|jgi:hypothetical protein